MLIAVGLHLARGLRLMLPCIAGVRAIAFVPLTWSQEKRWKNDSTVFTVGHQLAPRSLPSPGVWREFPEDWYAWAGR